MDSGSQIQVTTSPKFIHGSPSQIAKSKTMSEIYGKSDEDIAKAATKIQSLWRGYFVRHHNQRVFKLLQEIRFRRLEDHIQHLHGHLCRLTDFTTTRFCNMSGSYVKYKLKIFDICMRSWFYTLDFHCLMNSIKAKDLQKSVSVVLSKAKVNVFQASSEHDSSNRDLSRDNAILSDAKFDKHLPPHSDSLNLALKFSTQMYQENSSMYSPSSQTSSATSSVPDTSFNGPKPAENYSLLHLICQMLILACKAW
ncbi:centrosomal protein [Caerostris extrusa]|uniref:Centrosomal protein n=1 Tax=Caerostris extrusa TaxID=172846 RepID=A0AAV4Y612_CAEEX|nr:centrosomal protein [Caerostris extrusa]